MNTIMLIGRTTKEPEIRYPENGSANGPVARFTVAENFRNGNGEDEPIFWNCVAFGKTAEFIQQYIGKGDKLAIAGRITPNNYTDKEGKKVYASQLRVQTVEFAESKKQNTQPNQAENAAPQNWGGNDGNAAPQNWGRNTSPQNRSGNAAPQNWGGNAPSQNWGGNDGNTTPQSWGGNASSQNRGGNAAPQSWGGNASSQNRGGNAAPQSWGGNASSQNRSENTAPKPPMPPMPQPGFDGFAAAGFGDEELPFN